MYSRIKIAKDDLIISKILFISKIRINIKNITSIELYGKSVIPPLVFSIFLLIAQSFLFFFGKMNATIEGISIIFLINIPVIFCLIIAILRSKYTTMKISSSEHDDSLVLHFISRSKGETTAKEIHKIMNK
jgi:ABC-type molybdate transport system permease subunit